jgi:hypothetical protein
MKPMIITPLLMLPVLGLHAQVRQHRAHRWQGEPPEIDGRLTEQGWESSTLDDGFIQREPYEGERPGERTMFKILYDDDNLYVSVRACDSEPNRIERRLSRRDEVEGDRVSIEIDSYFDRLTGYVFKVNAAGVKGDSRITNDGQWDNSWDPVWYVDVSVDSLGWLAEIKIPYSQLRFATKDEYIWGLQCSRWIHRYEEQSTWQFIPQDASGWVSNYGNLLGIRNIEPHREVELIPYGMVKLDNYKKEDGNPFSRGREFGWSAGLDVRWRPLQSLSLSAGPSYVRSHSVMQYVETISHEGADKYLVARIDRQTLSANIRINLSITPDLSIQYWGQPFVFAGDYSEFKRVVNPRAGNFNDQFQRFPSENLFYSENEEVIEVDENSDGQVDYSFENPDFKVYEFRSNLVLRWEYIPGSSLFLVWSQGRSDSESQGYFNFGQDMDSLFNVFPHDVFMVKLTYRISV